MPKNLPARTTGTAVATTGDKQLAMLAKIRAAKAPAPVAVPRQNRASLLTAAMTPQRRPRLVLAVDATASREPAWAAARQVTDTLFFAVPGGLDVALAVHGGSTMHTFTPFSSDASALRDHAASIRCRAGQTRLLEILERVRDQGGVRVIVYIGDVFEESLPEGLAMADALKLRGARLIVLHDTATGGHHDADTFAQLAGRTGGCVLPFDVAAVDRLRELLEAVAMLAAGGVKLLQAKVKALPAARLLLEHLGAN
jgi:hypothetical protein